MINHKKYVLEEKTEVIDILNNNKDFIQNIKRSLFMVFLENDLISKEVFDLLIEKETV